MSKTVQPRKNGSARGDAPRSGEASQAEFLSYEQIWRMTDGGHSTETDAALLHQVRAQYEAAQNKAREIVLAAREEAGRIEQEAYRKGFEQGREEGEQAGRQQFEKVVRRFEGFVASCNAQRLQIDQAYQEKVLELIKAMADRLTGIEISTNPAVIRAALENALAMVADNLMVRVRLNPADYRNLMEAGLPGIAAGDSRVQLVEDKGIAAGGCLLSTDYGEVDATLATRRQLLFEAVEQAFAAALLNETPNGSGGPREGEEEADPWLL